VDLRQKKTAAAQGELDQDLGEFWIWTALDSPTRLIVNYLLGRHSLKEAHAMIQEIASSSADGKPLFVSDELAHYATSLEDTHSCLEPVPRAGKRGRPANPKKVVDSGLDYATVKKTRQKGHIVKVERAVVFGTEESVKNRLESSPSKTINTSYIERGNLDWRLWDAHLARKTSTFAKSSRWLKAKLSICIFWRNFVRPHSSLGKISKNNARQVTPAMAAGIASRPWTAKEVVREFLCVN
jgi:IS1 family transposase